MSTPINLAPLPLGWTESATGQRGIGNKQAAGKIIYPAIAPDGSQCLKLLSYGFEPYLREFGGGDREINSKFLLVAEGKTITFSADFWTEPSTIGDTNWESGAQIGADIYGSKRVGQINNNGGVGILDSANGVFDLFHVDALNWGSNGWRKMGFTYVMPKDAYYDTVDGLGQEWRPSSFKVSVGAIIPWIGGRSIAAGTEGAAIYIKNIQLFVSDNVVVTPTCPSGQHWDATLQACVLDVVATCPAGQHWDANLRSCVNDVVVNPIPTCPAGQHWDANFQACVINVTPEPMPPLVISGSISVGGFPFGGYALLLPPSIVRQLWKLRQKYIKPEVHKKLHPLV